MNEVKSLGQVFTPKELARQVLEVGGLLSLPMEERPSKKILEPSVGEGIFLEVLIEEGFNPSNIYAFELDSKLVKKVRDKKIIPDENLLEGSALTLVKNFYGNFDYVVGNPPYVRIHNLDLETIAEVQKLRCCQTGMIDLYLAFFDIGTSALKDTGVLTYITPNSFIKSLSGRDLRAFIEEEDMLVGFIDFKEEQKFEGYSTYTAITALQKGPGLERLPLPWGGARKKVGLSFNDLQNGIATLRDGIFIHRKGTLDIEPDIIASCYKASTGEMMDIIFPYNRKTLSVLDEDFIANQYPKAYAYLLHHKEELESRSISPSTKWYQFGRSQGLRHFNEEKIAISALNPLDEIRATKLPKETLVYSGLYATSDDLDILLEELKLEELLSFLAEKGTPKRGGYIQIGSSILKEF